MNRRSLLLGVGSATGAAAVSILPEVAETEVFRLPHGWSKEYLREKFEDYHSEVLRASGHDGYMIITEDDLVIVSHKKR